MERGYVKLWRKTLDSGLLQNATAWQVFGYLLLNATHKRTRLLKDTTPVTLEPGQVLSGRKKIAQECKLSEKNVRTALKLLVNLQIVAIKPTNKYSIITFINWDTYQQEGPAGWPTERPASGQQVASTRPASGHIQEHKNIRTKEEDNKYFCAELDKPAHTQEAEPAVISLPLVSGGMHHITQANIDRWKELFPGVDVMNELRRMLAWLEANPRQRKTPRGIARFIQGWLDREQNRARAPHASPETPRKTWAEMEEERSRAEFLRMTGGAANG